MVDYFHYVGLVDLLPSSDDWLSLWLVY